MRIYTINIRDLYGGAGKAANRIHQGLLAHGVNARMLVRDKQSDDNTVDLTVSGKLRRALSEIHPIIDRWPLRKYKNRKDVIFSTSLSSDNFVGKINAFKPDVVHMHWLNRGFFNIGYLKKIKAPVVISLHDMWTFTGGCHYNEECSRFTIGCGQCPLLGSNTVNDISSKQFKRKQHIYSNLQNFTVVGLSRWMAQKAAESPLTRNAQVVNLPNGIDTSLYKPINKEVARDIFNLPKDKTMILFGAMDATSDVRKGAKYLFDAVNSLNDKNIELMIFGSSNPPKGASFNLKANYLGKINDEQLLAVLYSAADLTIVPSLQENLSNVIMESMACGTPVAGFNIGGNSDMIVHEKTGYLAASVSAQALAKGIADLCSQPNHLKELGQNARQWVLQNFEIHKVVEQYIDLYSNIIRAAKAPGPAQ
ncbi:MAG: glycosyltransferase [Bacteroidales bacterium]|nr:glycosyltransferase [Bacteroidales bacterium]